MEKFFWADEIADRIIKERGKKKQYVCASGITPSGIVHIGNFREVITTDLVVRALRDKNKKGRIRANIDGVPIIAFENGKFVLTKNSRLPIEKLYIQIQSNYQGIKGNTGLS